MSVVSGRAAKIGCLDFSLCLGWIIIFGDDDIVFQHDYAPKKSEKFLKERNIATLEWLSNSSDLHIAEFVWQRIKAEVRMVTQKL